MSRTRLLLLGLALVCGGCRFDAAGIRPPADDRPVAPDRAATEAAILGDGRRAERSTIPGDAPHRDGPDTDGPRADRPRDIPTPPKLDGKQKKDALVPCPKECLNNCATGICDLDCAGGCKCPPGQHCVTTCHEETCTKLIDCSAAASCEVTCSGAGSCTEPITCGPGPCTVNCSGADSCKKPISCALTVKPEECTVTCSGEGSCVEPITCGTGACHVVCSGKSSCKKAIDCSKACGCAVQCNGPSSCASPVTCPTICPGCKGVACPGSC